MSASSGSATSASGVSNPDSDPADFNIDAAMDQHGKAAGGGSASSGDIDWRQVVAGGLLLGWGLSRGAGSGLLIAVAGGALAYRGLGNQLPVGGGSSAPDGESSVRVEKAVTVNRAIDEVYAEWREIEQLPRIMSHLESVQDLGNGMSHWVAKAPFGRTVEWDAEIIHDHESRVISWRSVEGADVPNVGAVHFHEAPGDRGTEVRVRIEYSPPAGKVGATVAKLFGEEPGQQVSDDLRRFKQYMEAGEIPTTEGQPRGGHQHSVMDAVMDKARQGAEAVNATVKGADTAPSS